MNEIEVQTTIHEAFDGIIPPLVDIEILQSVGSSLVQLVLAPRQPGVDGMIVHRLFKSKNKPMYVRPNRVLIPELVEVCFYTIMMCFDMRFERVLKLLLLLIYI